MSSSSMRLHFLAALLGSFSIACTSVPIRDRDGGEDATMDRAVIADATTGMDTAAPEDRVTPVEDTGVTTDVASMPTDTSAPRDTGAMTDTSAPRDVSSERDSTVSTDARIPADSATDSPIVLCGRPLIACSGRCVDIQTDPNNCGACGDACSGGMICAAGRCRLCVSPLSVCSGSCIDLNTNHENCGRCGQACGPSSICVGARCLLCPTGQTACGNTCVNTSTSTSNCGACGAACPATGADGAAPRCESGSCYLGVQCDPEMADCDRDPRNGYETNTDTSASHCGACGNACPFGQRCCNGGCTSSLRCPLC